VAQKITNSGAAAIGKDGILCALGLPALDVSSRGRESLTSATFTNDELILVLIGLVRATHPSMLRQDADGFSVDFEVLAEKKKLTADERLLLRMRAAMDVPGESPALVLELEDGEGPRLAAALAKLEALQKWSADVLEMSRSLRSRLAPLP
jgi:hypothetical protein